MEKTTPEEAIFKMHSDGSWGFYDNNGKLYKRRDYDELVAIFLLLQEAG